MKFQVGTVKTLYNSEDDAAEILRLESLGFKFEPRDIKTIIVWADRVICPGIIEMDFSSLEDLMAFIKGIGEEVILNEGTIRIYNGHNE